MRCVAETRRAFTLLEMLVAMTLMSVLAGVLYTSLHIGFAARESAQRNLAPIRSACLALSLVRSDLMSALPPTGLFAGAFTGTDGVNDQGLDADMLSFYTCGRAPGDAEWNEEEANDQQGNVEEGHSDIMKIDLGLGSAQDTGEPALIRYITTNLLPPETVEPAEELLCRGVRSLNITYFDGTDWYDDWDSTQLNNALPVAVEITLEVQAEATQGSAAEAETLQGQEPKVFKFSQVIVLPCYTPPTGQTGAGQAVATGGGSQAAPTGGGARGGAGGGR
jgi:prepilin-type N-terminal cleavage/methylation domain-containing protein